MDVHGDELIVIIIPVADAARSGLLPDYLAANRTVGSQHAISFILNQNYTYIKKVPSLNLAFECNYRTYIVFRACKPA